MIKIVYNFFEQHFLDGNVRISENTGNNFTVVNGKIALKKIPSVSNIRNTPGDGIDGVIDQPMSVIRLNSSVSRKKPGDPTAENEGVILPDLMSMIFAEKPDGQVITEYKEITDGKPADWETNYSNYYTDEDGDGNYERVEQITSVPEWDESKTYYRKEETPITPPPTPGPTPDEWEAILGADIPDEIWNARYSEYYTRSGEYPNYVYTPVAPGIPTKDNEGTYYKPKNVVISQPAEPEEPTEEPEETEEPGGGT